MIDIIDKVTDMLHGILEAYHFVLSLPNLFISWLAGMPTFFQAGIVLVVTGVAVCMILKLKTFFTL